MRLAFIGASGHHYLRRAMPRDAVLAVVNDRHDRTAATRLADTLGQPSTSFDDVASMLVEFKPDLISVGVVYAHASEVITDCLPAGVPIVSDKPIATTWSGYDKLVTTANQPGAGPLLTEFDFRGRASFLAARRVVQEGGIGQVALITAQKSYRWGTRPAWYADREHYGSTLLWVASHAIDALRFVTGTEPVCRHAYQANVTRGVEWGTAEDVASATYSLPTGGVAMVHADFLRPKASPTHADDRFRIAGSKGLIEIRDNRCWLTTTDQPPTDITDSVPDIEFGKTILDAAMQGGTDDLCTSESLKSAKLLLETLDRADAESAHFT